MTEDEEVVEGRKGREDTSFAVLSSDSGEVERRVFIGLIVASTLGVVHRKAFSSIRKTGSFHCNPSRWRHCLALSGLSATLRSARSPPELR